MNNRQWSILIVLILVNYIVFSSLITFLMESNKPVPTPTRTPLPTFTVTLTRTPTQPPPSPTATLVFPPTSTPTTEPPPEPPTPVPPPPADTPAPLPPRTERTTHVVQAGESLSVIAAHYGVSVNSIQWLNGLTSSIIHVGQELIIPAPGEVIPSPTPGPEAPSPTPAPPPAEEGGGPPPEEAPPTEPPAEQHQFSGRIEQWWPNCGLAAVGKSKVLDANTGEPVNGVRIRIWNDGGYEAFSLVSGVGTTYGPGEYDIVLNNKPIDAKFYLAAWDWQTGPDQYVSIDSEVVTLEFNSGSCQPEGSGHQVVIVNWYRNW